MSDSSAMKVIWELQRKLAAVTADRDAMRAALLKQAERMEQEATDADNDSRLDDAEVFRMRAADCRKAAMEAGR